jgi:hypothetical protein
MYTNIQGYVIMTLPPMARQLGVMINDTVAAARAAGVLIVHAPSDCVGGYPV